MTVQRRTKQNPANSTVQTSKGATKKETAAKPVQPMPKLKAERPLKLKSDQADDLMARLDKISGKAAKPGKKSRASGGAPRLKSLKLDAEEASNLLNRLDHTSMQALKLDKAEADDLLVRLSSVSTSDEELEQGINALKAMDDAPAPLSPGQVADDFKRRLSKLRGKTLSSVPLVRFAPHSELVRAAPGQLPSHAALIQLLDPAPALVEQSMGSNRRGIDGIFLGAAIDAASGDLCFFPTYASAGAPAQFVQALFGYDHPVTASMLAESAARKAARTDAAAAKPTRKAASKKPAETKKPASPMDKATKERIRALAKKIADTTATLQDHIDYVLLFDKYGEKRIDRLVNGRPVAR